jgi:hypothetical protein
MNPFLKRHATSYYCSSAGLIRPFHDHFVEPARSPVGQKRDGSYIEGSAYFKTIIYKPSKSISSSKSPTSSPSPPTFKMRPFFDATELPSFRFSNESRSCRALQLNCTISAIGHPVASLISTPTPTSATSFRPQIERSDSAVTTPISMTTRPIEDLAMKAEVDAV